MDDALVARAVERNRGVRVSASLREILFRSAQITDAFFARRCDELDRSVGTKTGTVDFARERQHHRETTTVVVDARTDEPFSLTSNRQIGVARENSIEMRADHDGFEIARSVTSSDDVAGI